MKLLTAVIFSMAKAFLKMFFQLKLVEKLFLARKLYPLILHWFFLVQYILLVYKCVFVLVV